MNGLKTWWRRLRMSKFSSSVNKTWTKCNAESDNKRKRQASGHNKGAGMRWKMRNQVKKGIISVRGKDYTSSSSFASLNEEKGLLNHSAKSADESKIFGSKKFNRVQSSSKLFCSTKRKNKILNNVNWRYNDEGENAIS